MLKQKWPRQIKLVICLVLFVVAFYNIYTLFSPTQRSLASKKCSLSTSVGEAKIGGSFSLIDQNDVARDEGVLLGKPHLLYFGFSFCPDICPTDLDTMARVRAKLKQNGVDIDLVFITLDPQRDTSSILKSYVSAFDPEIIALTGTLQAVRQATSAWKVYAAKSEAPNVPGGYVMDHSSFTYLVGADGKYLTHFSHGTDVDEISKQVECMLKN